MQYISSKAGTDHPTHIGVERSSGVELVDTAVARNVERVLVVAEVAGGIAPGTNGATLATYASLGAECGIFVE
jgi:hypothetical protein